MKILVTGGAGFIGSNFVHYLHRERSDYFVTVYDALTYAGNKANLDGLNSDRFHFIEANICDETAIDKAVSECDAIVHFAAESHNDNSLHSPWPFVETNIIGTFRILEAVRKHKKRLHHISTDEVYGDLELNDPHKFQETTPYNPSSPYSSTKAGSDMLVRAWIRSFGVQATISNCSNNYGPYQFAEKLIPHMILNALTGKPLPIYGDGLNIRDWLYVSDHCSAIRCVLEKGRPGEVYNIGGNNEKNNLTVVNKICETLDQLKPLSGKSYKNLIQFVKDRPGHDQRYAIDAAKIQKELGWEPAENFESGLSKTISWYLKQHLTQSESA